MSTYGTHGIICTASRDEVLFIKAKSFLYIISKSFIFGPIDIGDRPEHCGMLSSIPRLSPLDVCTLLPSVVTAKNPYRHCQVSPGGATSPVENPCGNSFHSPPTPRGPFGQWPWLWAGSWQSLELTLLPCHHLASLETGTEAITRNYVGAAGALISVSGVAWGREPAGTLEGNPAGQGISRLPTLLIPPIGPPAVPAFA